VVISYQTSGPYTNTSATARYAYYGSPGTPDVRLDGNFDVLGGIHSGTMYPVYRDHFDTRKTVASPLDIGLNATYDSSARQGVLTAVLRNTTGNTVSGQLQVVIVERSIYYPWQGLDSLYTVERNMLPNASGEAVTIPAGDSLTKTRNFTIDPSWVDAKCDFVVFVQNNSTKEIYQGARTALRPAPEITYLKYRPVLPLPGADDYLGVSLRNVGTGDATGVTATLSTSDPYVSVTTPTASYGAIPRRADRAPLADFEIHVSNACPDPHLATMNLAISADNGYSTSTSFPLNITANPGLIDYMESGPNGWTHEGTNNQWHQATHRSTSPSHGWYSGTEGTWQYSNENDARLTTPYFTFGDQSTLRFNNWYATEQDYDYCLVEVNNGSMFWTPVASYTGSSGNWVPQSYPLPDYGDQTVRVRFRFLSDYNVTAEGWYVDDFSAGLLTGIGNTPNHARTKALHLSAQSPVSGPVSLNYELPAPTSGRLSIFDVEGRLVRQLAIGPSARGEPLWNLTDEHGLAVRNGLYLVRLDAGTDHAVTRLVVAR
jgi:hypothetical protein